MEISEPAEYAILGLLEDAPMHGYEMFQRLQNSVLSQIVHVEMSQLYAFLKKLERLDFIAADLEPQGVRPPRRVYRQTAAGSEHFREWLTTPVERPREIRVLFLMKLYFVQKLLPASLPLVIEQEIATCQRFLASLEAQRQSTGSLSRANDFSQVVLSSRVYQTRALLAWLRELKAEFAQSC